MLKCTHMQNLIKICLGVQELWALLLKGKALSASCIPVAGQLKITNYYKYTKLDPNIPFGSRFTNIFTYWPQPAGLLLSKPSFIKTSFCACQRLENVDMHMFAKFYQYIPCRSKDMSNFTKWPWTDGRTGSHSGIIVHTFGSCNNHFVYWVSVWTMLRYLCLHIFNNMMPC